MMLATTQVEDVDQFLKIFSTTGAGKRRQHGSKGATVFADPNEEPVLEVAFLDGQQQPYVEMQDGFETDGVTWKIRHDYAVGAVGYRGAYKVTW